MNFSRRLLEDAYVIRDPFSPTTGHLTLGGQCCLCSKDICVAPVRLNYRIPGLQEIDSSDFRSPEVGISVTDPDGQRAQLLGLGQSGLLPTCCTCSKKILCDSCRVFLKYAKIKQVKGRLFCLSGIWFIPMGVLLGILDGGVLPGSSNPDPVSDQKM